MKKSTERIVNFMKSHSGEHTRMEIAEMFETSGNNITNIKSKYVPDFVYKQTRTHNKTDKKSGQQRDLLTYAEITFLGHLWQKATNNRYFTRKERETFKLIILGLNNKKG